MLKENRKCDYSFDEFFDSVIDYSFLNGKRIVRRFPKLKEEIESYKNALIHEKKSFEYFHDGRQYYSRVFYFDENCKYKYKVYWDINKAMNIITKYQLEPKLFEINKLMQYIDEKTINNSKLKKIDDKPIIVALYDPTNFIGVIDGNHRTYNAYLNNESTIRGYYLNHILQSEALACSTFRTLFRIHHNIAVINNYILGYIDEFTVSNGGFNNNLYKFNNYPHNNLDNKKDNFLKSLISKLGL